MNPVKIFLFVLLLIVGPQYGQAQQFYRFKADISVKDKLVDGTYRLTMGKVYYDKLYKKIVYKLSFPNIETMVIQDTTLFKIDKTNKLIESARTFLIPDFTVFHLALTGKLSDYGLKAAANDRAIYKIGKVEKDEKGLTTTWVPAEKEFKKVFGDIKMLTINKKLDAMIFYNAKGKIVSRQFFKKYVNVKGVEFPTEVTMISYAEDGRVNTQLTTYKNVLIDQNNEDEIYRYRIPITKSVTAKK
jgi:hypothetical protein